MHFNEGDAITDPRLLKQCLAVIALVVLGFVFAHPLGLEVATIALLNTAVLLRLCIAICSAYVYWRYLV